MKKVVVVLLSLLVPSVSHASSILVFGQNTGSNLITGTEIGGITTLNASGLPITITTLNDAASNINASFNFFAVSTAPVTNVAGSLYTQPYSGNFQITGGGTNYLSGIFSGIQLGLNTGQSFVFGSAQPPLTLSFTSDIAGMPLGLPTALALSFTNAFPGVSINNNSFGNFSSNVSGTFSAQAAEVPEPASLVLLGTGLLAVVRRRLKSRTVKQTI